MKSVKMNLMKEFGETGYDSEIIKLVNTCCQNINEYEDANNQYLAEIRNNISYFQNNFENINENFPEYISKLNEYVSNYNHDDIADIIQKSNRKMQNKLFIKDECLTERKIYKKTKNEDKMKKYFFIKDKNIVSETFFSYDQEETRCEYFELKCYFSFTENAIDIRKYIQSIKRLFKDYIILYRDNNSHFMKLIIIGRSGYDIKHKIRRIVNKTHDNCVIKINFLKNLTQVKHNVHKRASKHSYYITINNIKI
jgi:hypothetical protein